LVGQNIARLAQLCDTFPATRFATIVDDRLALEAISNGLSEGNSRGVDVFIDVDPGMARTGIRPNEHAVRLYQAITDSANLRAAGIHWYDGHIRQTDLSERRLAVDAEYQQLSGLQNQLAVAGFEVPEVVVSGTGAFPLWAQYTEPNMTLSPGTTVLFDVGYRKQFPDMNFRPALAVLTRVISTNRAGHLTLDLGHKSIAADQPAGCRSYLPELPDAKEIHHTEEHLVIETDRASEFSIGDALIAFPYHVCPTSALHQSVSVVEDGQVVDTWSVAARDRKLTI